jgi:tetratricopeptide (TPR) repeat protein
MASRWIVPTTATNSLDGASSIVPGALALESHLRKLCDAILELLPDEKRPGSVLKEVLPSLIPVICSCLPSTSEIRRELEAWEHRSAQLIRLATMHSSNGAAEFQARLERTTLLANRAIESIEFLKGWMRDADSASAQRGSIDSADSAGSSSFPSAESHLRELCLGLEGLLQTSPDHGSVLSQVIPSLAHLFVDCDDSCLEQLKAERRAYEVSAIQLLEIAATLSIHAANELRQRVARSLASAARAIRSLEAMRTTTGPGNGASDDRGDSDVSELIPGTQQPPVEAVGESDRARAEDLYAEAGRYQQQRDYEAAERLFTEALRFDPSFRLAYLHRGRVRLHLRQPAQAIVDLDAAIRLSSDDSLGFGSRGDALVLCGRFQDAIADYSRALELRPDNRVVRYNRAVAFRQAGNLSEAWDELALLVEIEPDNAALYLNRGMICVARGERHAAIREYRKAVSLQPDSIEATERLWELQRAKQSESKTDSQVPDLGGQSDREVQVDDGDIPLIPLGGPERISDDAISQILTDDSIPSASPSPDRTARTQSLNAAVTAGDQVIPVEEANSERQRTSKSRPGEATKSQEGVVSQSTQATVNSARQHQSSGIVDRQSNPDVESESGYQITIQCPSCQSPSSVRWDRLQSGKVLACRRCGGGFTSEEDGTLLSVEKGADGKWRRMIRRPTPWHKLRWVQGSVLSGLLAVTLLFLLTRPTRITEPELPEDLEPRAKLFAEAWLKKDYRIIRRLTHPAEGPQLFAWHKKHPAPELKQKPKIAVEVISDEPPVATLIVRLDGFKAADGSPRELALDWKEQNGQWLFLPTSETRLSSRTRAHIPGPAPAVVVMTGVSICPHRGSFAANSMMSPAIAIVNDPAGSLFPFWSDRS